MDYAYWFKRTFPESHHISFDDVDNLIERLSFRTVFMFEVIKVCCVVSILIPAYTLLFYTEFFSLHGTARWPALLSALYGALLFGRYCEQLMIKAYLKAALLSFAKPNPSQSR